MSNRYLQEQRVFVFLVMMSLALAGCQPQAAQPPSLPGATAVQSTLAPVVRTQSPTPTAVPANAAGVTPEWIDTVASIQWVAYTPPSGDPNNGIEASPEAIREDLRVLREAGFSGLVTYSSTGVMGRELPSIAQAAGFEGLIIGIWDITNQEELANAAAAADFAIVLGYCMGNEGLHKRYQLDDLASAIDTLRTQTGKSVATTEEIDDYSDVDLLTLGDWVFPNVHPYFHNQLDPVLAVRWTNGAFEDLSSKTSRFLFFKEVGLPTAGDTQGQLSEANQDVYYRELAKTGVHFVYFEAFDQPWKTNLIIEPHWGIFNADRSPKAIAWHLIGKEPTPTPAPSSAFYIYLEADSPENHYSPSGYMGDTGDIHLDPAFEETPNSGQTVFQVIYDAKGNGPSECPYDPPCKWAGVYWQEPSNNWGTNSEWDGEGFDLSGYTRLVFRARSDQPCTVEFKVGGINQTYGDSLFYARSKTAKLTQQWEEYSIDLQKADLTHIIGGFVWAANWEKNPAGATFYLDDIRFEK